MKHQSLQGAHHILRSGAVRKAPHPEHPSWERVYKPLSLLDMLHILLGDLKYPAVQRMKPGCQCVVPTNFAAA